VTEKTPNPYLHNLPYRVERIDPPTKVYVDQSTIPGAGRGVFAKEDIAAGEVFEVAPVIVVPFGDPATDEEKSVVPHYYFTFKWWYGFALGYATIYNHAYEPNALYEKDDELGAVIFTARYDIKAGEEIFTTYNNSDPSDKSTPMNFGIPPYQG